jgi:uncharacterized membrane protein
MPMLALTFASAVCVGLVLARIISTGNLRYCFLVWNLFLAWLPLVFALLAQETFERQGAWSWRLALLGGIWLLFFPNAPYIFTDLSHLTARFAAHFWVDLMLILSCALTGLVLGFVSLYLVQGIVLRASGAMLSWLFVAGVAALSGFGVWLGRFLRFNSWDVVFRPVELYRGIGSGASEPLRPAASFAFAALFALFLFITYVMLYALTQLRRLPATAPPPVPEGAKPANRRVALAVGATSE